jgi:hypothetical protein
METARQVTGIVSASGDWLDSVEYVCSSLLLLTPVDAQLRAHTFDVQAAEWEANQR